MKVFCALGAVATIYCLATGHWFLAFCGAMCVAGLATELYENV